MARDGSGVYTLPAGLPTNGETSNATDDILTPFNDLATDMNTPRPVVAGGTGSSTASAARTALGLAIGTNVQAYDAGLASIAGLTTAANKMIYTTALDTYAVADLTAYGRSIAAVADEAAFKALVNLEIGTDVQAYDADLAAIAALSRTRGDLIRGGAAAWERVALGTSGYGLRSDGTDAVWAPVGPVLLATRTASASATLDFTEFNNAVYSRYKFVLKNVKPATDLVNLWVRFSTNGGGAYDAAASDYVWVTIGRESGGNNTNSNSSGAAAIVVTGNGTGVTDGAIGNAATEFGVSGTLELMHAGDGAAYTRLSGVLNLDGGNSSNLFEVTVSGKRTTAQDTDALRFLMSSGNIASGSIEMWGLV